MRSLRACICPAATLNGEGVEDLAWGIPRIVPALGSASRTRRSLAKAAQGLAIPDSYSVNALVPHPINSPACTWVRPRRSRMARISSGMISSSVAGM